MWEALRRELKKFMHPYRNINDERLEVSHQISIHYFVMINIVIVVRERVPPIFGRMGN